MEVTELSRDQLTELKGEYLDNWLYENEGRDASMGEWIDADEIVSDDEIFREYEGVDFVNDDFFSTAGMSDSLFDADERWRGMTRRYAEDISVEDIERNASVVWEA